MSELSFTRSKTIRLPSGVISKPSSREPASQLRQVRLRPGVEILQPDVEKLRPSPHDHRGLQIHEALPFRQKPVPLAAGRDLYRRQLHRRPVGLHARERLATGNARAA